MLLAGVTIATLTGDNGILSQAQNASQLTEIARVEELANLELANSTIGARAYGNAEAGIADILSSLKSDNEIEAYGQTGNTTITGITFGQAVEQNGIELEIGAANAVVKAATFTSSDPSQDYWVQIRGKKYPIAKTNGVVKITKTEVTTGTKTTGEITDVSSNHKEYATVEKVSETTDKIKITGVAKGTATITVKYTNEIYTTIPVTVKGNVTVSTQVENPSGDEDVGTVNPSISEQAYAEGSSINLTAAVKTDYSDDYEFVGWYETKGSGTETQKSTNASYTYTVPNDGTAIVVLKAKFQEKPQTLGTTSDDSGVGYYINKGTAQNPEYAIVFADRVAQEGTTVTWSSTNSSSCTFPELTDEQKAGFKTYKINGTYTDPKTVQDSSKGFGTKNVLEIENNTGEDRFMALSLSDLATNGTTYHWYYAAYGNMSDYNNANTGTSTAFLSGKTNTNRMIAKWNLGTNGGYGEKDKACSHSTQHVDMWGQIQTKVSNGWFVPSKDEWSAFGWAMSQGKLKSGVTSYSSLGLSDYYWSSSQNSTSRAWYASLGSGFMYRYGVNYNYYVRLATTF